MYNLDGVRYYAGWADDPTITKARHAPLFRCVGVTDGPHEVRLGE